MDELQVFAGLILLCAVVGSYALARAGHGNWVGLPGAIAVAVGVFFWARAESLGGYEAIGPAVVALGAAALFVAMMLGGLVGVFVRWRRRPRVGPSRSRIDD